MENLDKKQKDVLMSPSPASKKAEIQAILDSNKSMQQKGQEVYDKYIEYIKDSKFKRERCSRFVFKTPQNVTDWYKNTFLTDGIGLKHVMTIRVSLIMTLRVCGYCVVGAPNYLKSYQKISDIC